MIQQLDRIPDEQMEPVDLSVKTKLNSRLSHTRNGTLETSVKKEERNGTGFVLKIPAYQSPLQNFRLTQNLGLKGGNYVYIT